MTTQPQKSKVDKDVENVLLVVAEMRRRLGRIQTEVELLQTSGNHEVRMILADRAQENYSTMPELTGHLRASILFLVNDVAQEEW